MLKQLWYDETGLTSVEYALVLAIMVLACFTVFTLVGAKVRSGASASANAVTTMH